MNRPPLASVIIPAHDEAAVIGRCLTTLLADAGPGEFEVVVTCNGCEDATAEVARATAPQALVVELAQADKTAALQAGDDVATVFPRFYLDADIELDTASARLLAAALLPGKGSPAASPRMVVRLAERSWPIRAFYRTWSSLPWSHDAHLGDGCYGLSAAGRARFDRWPTLVADDLFANRLFTTAERRLVPEATFVVHPPRTVRSLTNVRTRVHAGNLQYASAVNAGDPLGAPPDRARLARYARLLRSPLRWPELAVYLGVTATAKARARWRHSVAGSHPWSRDDTARTT